MGAFMRDNYDFSDAVRSSIPKRLKQQITININGEVVDYFKKCLLNWGYLIKL